MEYEKLTYLGVKELYPHPDNPRLDIGDITELVESVRANGILQNLTVIPGRKGTPEEMEHTAGRGAAGGVCRKPVEERA